MVSENQLVFNILDCDSVNHIVIFLTGTQPFPDGFGGSVYFCWPKPQPTWSLLGFISNEKPSAIFKIAKVVISIIILLYYYSIEFFSISFQIMPTQVGRRILRQVFCDLFQLTLQR